MGGILWGERLKVLVCGDRNWSDKQIIYSRLAELPPDTHIIHGDCKGADRLAGEAAKELGFVVTAVPADWKRYGKPAGPIRNKAMLDLSPDLVIAFHSDFRNSKGTKSMVNLAREAGVPVEFNLGATKHRVVCEWITEAQATELLEYMGKRLKGVWVKWAVESKEETE